MKEERIKCPYCSELILSDAEKCCWCGELITQKKWWLRHRVPLIIGSWFLVYLLSFLFLPAFGFIQGISGKKIRFTAAKISTLNKPHEIYWVSEHNWVQKLIDSEAVGSNVVYMIYTCPMLFVGGIIFLVSLLSVGAELDSRSLGKFVMFLTLVGFLFDILRWIPRPFVKPTDGYFLISFWHLLLAAIGLFFWIAPHNSFIEKSIAWLSGRKFSSKK